MSKHPTTVRLDPVLYKKVIVEAKKTGLNFSGVVHLLLQAFVRGTVHIGVTQYPEKYIEALEAESEELSRLYKARKVKGYNSSQELFGDILKG